MNWIIIFGCIEAIMALVFVIGISLYDTKDALHHYRIRRRPYARRYRYRPVIGIPATLNTSVDYKKAVVIKDGEKHPKVDLLLHAGPDTAIPKRSILQAAIYMNSHPHLTRWELPRQATQPTTLRQLLECYHLLAEDTMRKVRSGLGITLAKAPMLQTPNAPSNIYSYGAAAIALCHAVALTGLILYAIYVAGFAKQPLLLTVILACHALFIGIAVWWNDQLSFWQKVGYTAVSPVAIGYFCGLQVRRILEILSNMLKAIIPIGIRLFMGIKHILRIV